MNLKTKSNLVGDIAILCGAVATILAFISLEFDIKNVGFIIFMLMVVYSCLKDKYREIRCKEIDEEYKNRGK